MKKLFTLLMLSAATVFAQFPIEYLEVTDQDGRSGSYQTVEDILSNKADLDLSNPSDNDVLTYDSATGKYSPEAGGGGGGSASNLNSITDVELGTLTDGEVLTYDSSASIWTNADVSSTIVSLTSVTNYDASGIWLKNGSTFQKVGEAGVDDDFTDAIALLTDGDQLFLHEGTYSNSAAIGMTEKNVKILGIGGAPTFNWNTNSASRDISGGVVIRLAERWLLSPLVENFELRNVGLILDNNDPNQDVFKVNHTAAETNRARNVFINNVFVARTNNHCVIDQHDGDFWANNLIVGGLNGFLINGSFTTLQNNHTIDNPTTGLIIKADPTTHSEIKNINIVGHTFEGLGSLHTGGLQVQAINGTTVDGVTASQLNGKQVVNLLRFQGDNSQTATVKNIVIHGAYGTDSSSHMFWFNDVTNAVVSGAVGLDTGDDMFRIDAAAHKVSILGGQAEGTITSDALQNDSTTSYRVEVNKTISMPADTDYTGPDTIKTGDGVIGDVLVHDGTGYSRLSQGSVSEVLSISSSTQTVWQAAPAPTWSGNSNPNTSNYGNDTTLSDPDGLMEWNVDTFTALSEDISFRIRCRLNGSMVTFLDLNSTSAAFSDIRNPNISLSDSPILGFYDTNAAINDTDQISAQITANLTTTGNGTEDMDFTVESMSNGSFVELLDWDASVELTTMTHSQARENTTISSTLTLDGSHYIVYVDASGGAVTINLPASSADLEGIIYTIKAIDVGGGNVTIDGSGAQEIDGSTTVVLSTQYHWRTIQLNHATTEWFVIGSN